MFSEKRVEARRLFLIGLGVTALSALEALAERFEVVGVVREAAPRPDGRDELVELASKLGLPVSYDASMSSVRTLIETLRPDCVVISSYNRILPPDLLGLSRFINVHYAPLPKYRGRANVNWAIINGEKVAGISIHRVSPGLDSGNILFQETIPISDTDTVATLYERLNAIQRSALGDTVERFLAGFEGEPQDESQATYCCARLPEDGDINWSDGTLAIDRLVRALAAPYPGAFTWFEGRRLTIWAAKPVSDGPQFVGRVPGRIVAVSKSEGTVDVLTGDGALRLIEVQRDGDAPAPAASVIKSVKATLGLRLADLLKRIEQLDALVGERSNQP
jgi:methionyl-tRNA formyltransferase